MKKRDLQRRYRCGLSKGLAVLTGITMVAGNVLPVMAEEPEEVLTETLQEAGTEEDAAVNAVPAMPTEAEEADEQSAAERSDTEADDVVTVAGYLATPDEYEGPGLEGGWEYRELRDLLVDAEGTEVPLLMSTSVSASVGRAYPCTYTESWLKYFTERYPVTRHQGPYGSCWAHTSMALAVAAISSASSYHGPYRPPS